MPTPNKYPKEFREKAVRIVVEMDSPDEMTRFVDEERDRFRGGVYLSGYGL